MLDKRYETYLRYVRTLARRLAAAWGRVRVWPWPGICRVLRAALLAAGPLVTVLACQSCDAKTVVLTGSMTTLPQAVTNFQLFEKLYGIRYIIPENATFATAIGAGLCSLRKKPEA